jgi:hypothetical protein
MRKLTMLLTTVALVIGVMVPALAGGVTADNFAGGDANCFAAGPDDNIHCLAPGQGNGAALNVMVFGPEGQAFLGTEILRFTDRDLSKLPCRGEKDGYWVQPFGAGTPVWACHHWIGR